MRGGGVAPAKGVGGSRARKWKLLALPCLVLREKGVWGGN